MLRHHHPQRVRCIRLETSCRQSGNGGASVSWVWPGLVLVPVAEEPNRRKSTTYHHGVMTCHRERLAACNSSGEDHCPDSFSRLRSRLRLWSLDLAGRSDGRVRLGPAQAPISRVGMLIAPVYRIRVTGIPLATRGAKRSSRPSRSSIGSTRRRVNRAAFRSVPIDMTRQVDLRTRPSGGKFVTRVIYLEDPQVGLAGGRRPQKSAELV